MLQYAASRPGLHCLLNTLCWYTELKELIQVPFKFNIFIFFNFLFSEKWERRKYSIKNRMKRYYFGKTVTKGENKF